ncbi:YfdX family protein [Pseudomonadota bacterium]
MNCSILKSVIAMLLLSGVAVPHATWAKQAQEDVRDAVTSTVPAAQREAIASAALRTLRHITRARSAIHNNDLDQARQDVQQARELLALVEAARPAVRLKEHLWVVRQHMGYETAEDIIDDLTLIDAELLSFGDIIPTATAHRHLQNAQAFMMKNNTEAARQELDRLEASLVFTEFDLPLATCEQQILAAQEALTRNQPAAADKNLVAAEESIQFINLGGSAPLVSARTHLNRAAKNYRDQYYAAAKADLAQASEWLRRAGKDADEKGRKEAQKLATKIDALKDKLDTEADDHTHTLGNFLHRSAVLIGREAEDLWLRYKQQRSANITLRKLLDAKMHLFYAEYHLTLGRDTDVVRNELEATDRYLEEALSEAGPPVRERINQLRKEVHALEENLDGDREQTKARYEQTMADLIQLIHDH